MGLLQFFGVITALDCSDDLISMGLVGLIIGAILCHVGHRLFRNWD